jgi:hypothetical protein
MTWLYERSDIIIVIGVVLMLGLGIGWTNTGRKELAIAAGFVLLLVVACVVIAQLVVTDSESLRQTLDEIAHDAETNDHRALLRHLSENAPELKQRAEKEMPNYRFTDCHVSKVHSTTIDSKSKPKTASVEFNVVFSGNFRYEGFQGDYNGARWIKLEFVQDKDGRWKVENYEHDDPQRMIMKKPEKP